MNISISNLAWRQDEEISVAQCLVQLGIAYIEIAPVKIWSDFPRGEPKRYSRYRLFWEDRGISIVALQSLLFERPELVLFGSRRQRIDMIVYIKKAIDVASLLGAQILVFGSPKNRVRGCRDAEDAKKTAIDFFYEIGEYCRSVGDALFFCIEPNASMYGCDFITTVSEAKKMVREVQNAGFQLHVDFGCMDLEQEDPAGALQYSQDILKHVHVSAPWLGHIKNCSPEYIAACLSELKKIGYNRYISIEMNEIEKIVPRSNKQSLVDAIDFLKALNVHEA